MLNPITHYIPQRPPMVMIDKLENADETAAATSFYVSAENIFVENGVLKEPGLIENIAQTAAAQVGYLCDQKKAPVPIGYIAAIRHLKIFNLPLVGTTLQTSITRKNQIMNIILIEGTTTQSGEVICTCEMRVFVKSES